MGNVAIFVDAGYLLAAGGQLCLGVPQRPKIRCDFAGLVDALTGALVEDDALLRVYWYDAAEDGLPTADQNDIADLAKVKLRLGRLVQGRQKGVDALIVRDLIRLARNRAMTMAWIVSGDEDLRPAIEDVQEMGIGVGIAVVGAGLTNRSLVLLREADEVLELTKEVLEPHLSVRDATGVQLQLSDDENSPEAVGIAFADRWLEKASHDQRKDLLAGAPKIPRQLDADLLEEAEGILGAGSLDEQEARHRLRQGFWRGIKGGSPG